MGTNWGGANWLDVGEVTSEEDYKMAMVEAAWKELEEKQRIQELTGEIQSDRPMFRFGVDYGLGDIVALRIARWKMGTTRRIKEIEENWDNGVYTRRITIGDPKPTIMREVKNAAKGK